MSPQPTAGPAISPRVLVDDTTVEQTAALLQRLTDWLRTATGEHARSCADALSLGDSDDPESIAGWADCLAARLRHCSEAGEP